MDIYISYLIAKLVKGRLETKGIQSLIAPPYYWGINKLTGCFPGSFSVRPETMKALLVDTLSSLKKWGVDYVFNINWHGEYSHNIAILEAVKEARAATGIKAYYILGDDEIGKYGLKGKEDYIIVRRPITRRNLLQNVLTSMPVHWRQG